MNNFLNTRTYGDGVSEKSPDRCDEYLSDLLRISVQKLTSRPISLLTVFLKFSA